MMMNHQWLTTPVGIDAERWISRRGCRTVLIVVHTLASCHRLMDVAELIEADTRVQAVFTVAPDVFNRGLEWHLHTLGALVMAWTQAIREPFDLAIAAAHGGLHEIHAPVVVMAHGAGRSKLVRPPQHGGPAMNEPAVYGLDAARLTRDGRVLASAIILSHDTERDVLSRQCPDALTAAVVAGDTCFDRLVASLTRREQYRRALNVTRHQKIILVCSTWGPEGLYGGVPDLLPRIMDDLPSRRFRVVALLHPAVWGAHGSRQIRAWTRDCREAGMLLPEPTQDWRAFVAAADYLIGDHGSVTAYGAAVGLPVLTTGHVTTTPAHGSPQALVMAGTRRLDPTRPLRSQLAMARPLERDAMAAAITSRPGQSGQLIRRLVYDLLRLPEHGRHRGPKPVQAPQLTRIWAA